MEPKTYVICKNTFLDPHSKKALNLARRAGYAIEAKPKINAGTNRQNLEGIVKCSKNLDDDGEEIKKMTHVPLDVRQLIQNGRQAKGLTQKELAQKINEKQSVIKDYESGNAIMNEKMLKKIERVLGIKLCGKDRGQHLSSTGKV